VDLRVNPAAIILDKLVGVAGVAVHLVEAIGGTAIGEEDSDLVGRLRVLSQVVL
jgi:hypothetical protein